MRALSILSLSAFVGMALLLSEQRWISRPRMTDRLSPYAPGFVTHGRPDLLSVASFREVIAPLSQAIGEGVARVFGVSEELGIRLRRIHSPWDVTTFRVRQLGWASPAFVVGTLIAVGLELPTLFAVLGVLGAPMLTFLLLEQQVVRSFIGVAATVVSGVARGG